MIRLTVEKSPKGQEYTDRWTMESTDDYEEINRLVEHVIAPMLRAMGYSEALVNDALGRDM